MLHEIEPRSRRRRLKDFVTPECSAAVTGQQATQPTPAQLHLYLPAGISPGSTPQGSSSPLPPCAPPQEEEHISALVHSPFVPSPVKSSKNISASLLLVSKVGRINCSQLEKIKIMLRCCRHVLERSCYQQAHDGKAPGVIWGAPGAATRSPAGFRVPVPPRSIPARWPHAPAGPAAPQIPGPAGSLGAIRWQRPISSLFREVFSDGKGEKGICEPCKPIPPSWVNKGSSVGSQPPRAGDA